MLNTGFNTETNEKESFIKKSPLDASETKISLAACKPPL